MQGMPSLETIQVRNPSVRCRWARPGAWLALAGGGYGTSLVVASGAPAAGGSEPPVEKGIELSQAYTPQVLAAAHVRSVGIIDGGDTVAVHFEAAGGEEMCLLLPIAAVSDLLMHLATALVVGGSARALPDT